MGRIKELIKSFINPIQPEKSFDELAVAAGIGEADLKMLKSSREGIDWKKFAREDEEVKTSKKLRLTQKQAQVQQEQSIISRPRNTGKERD